MTREEIIIEINKTCGKNSYQLKFFNLITEKIPKTSCTYIPYELLIKVTKDFSPTQIQSCINYFTGNVLTLFEMKFAYSNKQGNKEEISSSVLLKAFRTGHLILPSTGENIKNFEKYVYIYFRCTKVLEGLLNN